MKLQLTKKKLKQLSGYQVLDSKMTIAVTGANAASEINPELTSMDARVSCRTSVKNKEY